MTPTSTRTYGYLQRLGVLLLFAILFAPAAPAQSPDVNYWLPGGVQLLAAGASNKFPDDIEARRWLVGFMLEIDTPCGFQPNALASVFGIKLLAYIASATPHATEGSEDGKLFLQSRGCGGNSRAIFDTVIEILLLHGGSPPEADDKKQFLLLASPQLLKRLGTTREQAEVEAAKPPWWQSYLGTWYGSVPVTDGGKESTYIITLTMKAENGKRWGELKSSSGLGAGVEVDLSGENQVIFQRCDPVTAGYHPAECGSKESNVEFDGRPSPDGKTLQGQFTVWFWTPKTSPVVLSRTQPALPVQAPAPPIQNSTRTIPANPQNPSAPNQPNTQPPASSARSTADPAAAAAISGNYRGQYVCGQGVTALVLQVVGNKDGSLTAMFRAQLPGRQGPAAIAFSLSGHYDPLTMQVVLTPVRKEMPSSVPYLMVGMAGVYDPTKNTIAGKISDPSCGAFEVRRQ